MFVLSACHCQQQSLVADLMVLYKSESLGYGDEGMESTGNSCNTGSRFSCSDATRGLRWYDSKRAVQSRPIAKLISQLPAGCLSINDVKSYATPL